MLFLTPARQRAHDGQPRSIHFHRTHTCTHAHARPRTQAEHGVAFVDLGLPYRDRGDLHEGVANSGRRFNAVSPRAKLRGGASNAAPSDADCTHYCYSAEGMGPMFDALWRALRCVPGQEGTSPMHTGGATLGW